jgi:hypothetical protein
MAAKSLVDTPPKLDNNQKFERKLEIVTAGLIPAYAAMFQKIPQYEDACGLRVFRTLDEAPK